MARGVTIAAAALAAAGCGPSPGTLLHDGSAAHYTLVGIEGRPLPAYAQNRALDDRRRSTGRR